MHPIIFRIGAFQLHSYGVAMGLAFVLGIWWAVRRAHLAGVQKAFIFDLAVVVMISSLIGARLTYVAAHWSEYARHPLDIISPIQSDGTIGIQGMVLLGGIFLAVLCGGWYVKRKGVSFWAMADVSAPPLALGIGIGRIGCYLNGCCFGHPINGIFGVIFPSGCYAGAIYPGIRIHPTQLYSAGAAFLTAILLVAFARRRGTFVGWTASLFLILSGIDRVIVEGYRYYPPDKYFKLLGTQWTGSRVVALMMVAAGILAFAIMSKSAQMVTGKQADVAAAGTKTSAEPVPTDKGQDQSGSEK